MLPVLLVTPVNAVCCNSSLSFPEIMKVADSCFSKSPANKIKFTSKTLGVTWMEFWVLCVFKMYGLLGEFTVVEPPINLLKLEC